MGVDCTLFARRARRAIYLDRLYYWYPSGDDTALYDKLRSGSADAGGLDAAGLESLCRALIAEEAADTAAGESPDRNQKTWLWEVCIRFAQEHPDDEFFVQTDNEEPSDSDVVRRDGYTRWDPYYGDDKLAPWHPGYVEPKYDPPPPLTPEEQARQHENIRLLAQALEAGSDLMQGSPLIIEDLAPVMRCVTYTIPSEPRTWRESLQYINWHWLDLFTDGPCSFWWHVRNKYQRLKFLKTAVLSPEAVK